VPNRNGEMGGLDHLDSWSEDSKASFPRAALAARQWEELPTDSVAYMGVFPRTHT
jgi:hypothetical protein